MVGQIIASMLGVLAFGILFHVPKKYYPACAFTGAICWASYLLFLSSGCSSVIACLGSTFLLTVLCRIMSPLLRAPVTIFLIPGIFPLVPGAGIYYTAYYLIMNDMAAGSAKGLETFKIAGAIVLGILFGSALPQSWFHALAGRFHKSRSRNSTKKKG